LKNFIGAPFDNVEVFVRFIPVVFDNMLTVPCVGGDGIVVVLIEVVCSDVVDDVVFVVVVMMLLVVGLDVVLRLVVAFIELMNELVDVLVFRIVELRVMLVVVVDVVAFISLLLKKLSVFCPFGLRMKLALSNTTIARIRISNSL